MNQIVNGLRRVFHHLFFTRLLLVVYFAGGATLGLTPAPLHIGAATVDITPERPVALDGQRLARISKTPATRIYAAVLALESRDGDQIAEHEAALDILH